MSVPCSSVFIGITAPSVSQASNDARHELLVTTSWNEIVKRDSDLRSIIAAEGFDI